MGPVLGNLDPYSGTCTRLCTQKMAQYRWLIQYLEFELVLLILLLWNFEKTPVLQKWGLGPWFKNRGQKLTGRDKTCIGRARQNTLNYTQFNYRSAQCAKYFAKIDIHSEKLYFGSGNTCSVVLRTITLQIHIEYKDTDSLQGYSDKCSAVEVS